jgi:transketolase C-terminal domain/subunit
MSLLLVEFTPDLSAPLTIERNLTILKVVLFLPEEHNINGGLGSAVAEVCMDNGISPKAFLRIGLDDRYSSIVGSQDYLKAYYEMDSSAIVKKVQALLE